MKKRIAICRLICLSSILFFCIAVSAQSRGKVKGRVLSIEGTPLEAAAVSVKGTNHGDHTKEDGGFRFSVPTGNIILQVSYLGSSPQEVNITVRAGESTNVGDIIFSKSEKELSEVVVSGTEKLAQKNSDYVARMPLAYIENPQVYTVVSKELLDIQVVTNMEDALKNIAGASNVGRGFGSGGVGVQIMQRGFSSNVNMRNGMSTNSLALTDPINIERIEAIKGPSGALFGTTVSYGGLINKVTKKPKEWDSYSFSYTTGSWSNNRFTADINHALNKEKTLLLRVNSLYAKGNNFMDASKSMSWAIDPSITYKATDRLTFNLDVEIFYNEGLTNYVDPENEDVLHDKYGISSFKDLKYDWKRSYADRDLLSTTQTFNTHFEAVYKISDNWTSQTAYSHSGVDLNSNYFFLKYATPDSLIRSVNRIPGTFDRDQFQQNFTGEFKIGSMKNRLLFGIDYLYTNNENKRTSIIYDKVKYDQENVNLSMEKVENMLATSKTTGPHGSKTSIYSAYVSDVLNITKQLNVLAALRVDHYIGSTYEQTSVSPKFGIVYEIMKDRLSVFGNFLDGFKNNGSGYNSPDAALLTDWKPEHATQFEGGLKTQLFDERIIATVGVYQIDVKNIVRSTTSPSGSANASFSTQDGERISKGFDIDITALPLPGWTLVAGYGYNDSKYKKTSNGLLDGNRPGNLPLHSVNFWTDYKLTRGSLKGLGVGIGGNYIGKSYYSDKNILYNPERFTADATIYYGQSKYRVSLKMNNLMNEQYWTLGRGAQPMKSREILGSISFTL